MPMENSSHKLQWCLFILSCLVAILSIMLHSHSTEKPVTPVLIPTTQDLMKIFTFYDENKDGQLSKMEFFKMGRLFKALQQDIFIAEENARATLEIGESDEYITVESLFTPLILESMKKDLSEDILVLKGLLDWKHATVLKRNFPVKSFCSFLPDIDARVGEIWYVIAGVPQQQMGLRSSNRHYPEPVTGKAVILHHLLKIFHQNTFLQTRFNPQGTVATLRAENEEYLDIIFRCHAEFQLNDPPLPPFWFTPSQFQGRLVISRDREHIMYFSLEVPNDRKLNVDMEWVTGEGEEPRMEVDIGFLPEMKLQGGPSAQALQYLPNGTKVDLRENVLSFQSSNVDKMKWRTVISIEEGYGIIEKVFYSFKEIPYFPLPIASTKSIASNLLLHSIVLWGALDDQSC